MGTKIQQFFQSFLSAKVLLTISPSSIYQNKKGCEPKLTAFSGFILDFTEIPTNS